MLYRICVEQNVWIRMLCVLARSFALFPLGCHARRNLRLRGVGFVQWRVAWYIAGADGAFETDKQTSRHADRKTNRQTGRKTVHITRPGAVSNFFALCPAV